MKSNEFMPGTSGHVLPRILREKLLKYPPSSIPEGVVIATCADEGSANCGGGDDDEDDDDSPSSSSTKQRLHRMVETSQTAQLEEMIQKTTQALLGIQKQIHRGEEVYYEDTYGFGGLFTGFDGVLDARGVGEGGGGGGGNMLRRMPGDARWFSLPLRVYPAIPPPAITNDVPVTFEAEASTAEAKSAAAASSTSPGVSNDKDTRLPKTAQDGISGTERKKPADEDESKPQQVDEDDAVDDDNDAPGDDDEEEETPVAVAAPRETRSKRKSMTPIPTRRTKRKKR